MSNAARTPHITDEQIAQARAVDMVRLVGGYLPLRREGRRFVGLCPFHKEKTPSFGVEALRGNFKCFGCGAGGDAIEFVRRIENIDFVSAVERLSRDVALPQRIQRAPADRPSEAMPSAAVTKARSLWQRAHSVIGTPAEVYLRARGISTFPASVRVIDHYNWFADVMLPCMVVAVQSPLGHVTAVQLTALTLDGARKAFSKNSRRTEGALGCGAARFAAASDLLGIAEGAEKAIAAQYLTGAPVWASLGAARMHSVAIPENVFELHIFADDDDAGREAAERTAARHKSRRVIVRYAPEGCKDWDEVLLARRYA